MSLLNLLSVTVSVPEPTTMLLLATGLGGLPFEAHRRRKNDRE